MTTFIMSIIIIIKVDSLNENITVSDTGGQEKFKRVEENFNALQTALRDIQSDNSNKIQKVADIRILLLQRNNKDIISNNDKLDVKYFTVQILMWYFSIPPDLILELISPTEAYYPIISDWTSAIGIMCSEVYKITPKKYYTY